MTPRTSDEQEKRLEAGTSSDGEETHSQKASHNAVASTCKGTIGYLNQDIRTSMFAEFQLVILTFCTGIQGKYSRISFIATLLSLTNTV